ncbi:MAG: R3H domain-containing nucleic acid-binding protein [Patescibacteria group bacterium]
MLNLSEIEEIEKIVKEVLEKMTMINFKLESFLEENSKEDNVSKVENIVCVNINLSEPKFLIGRDGQTLLDLQRILRIVLNKKLNKNFYLKLDINNYQKQKIKYLKNMARSLADEVVLTKKQKPLPPMAAYDRRIIHEELSHRKDVFTTSQGEGDRRGVIVSPN